MATTPPTVDTSALNPQFLALYNAQLPQLMLAQQQADQARGGFYSGNAIDAQTKAQSDLLASLLAQQQAQTQQTSINEANINQAQSAQENQTKAANRNTNMGLIGSGVGALATLGGLKAMQPGGIFGPSLTKNTMMIDGQPVTVNGDGTYTPMQPTGVGGSAIPNNGVGGLAPSSNSFDTGAGLSGPPAPGATPSLDSLAGVGPTPDPLGLSMPGASGALDPSLSAGMSSLPDSGLNGLTDLATTDLGSIGGDAASSGLGALSSFGGDAASSGLGGLASFAKGGIISKPTIAQIGDAGPGNPEEVIPLNKLQGAVGPAGAAAVMAAVPQPGGQPQPQPSMWSQPSPQGPTPPAPASPLNALQRGGLLGNLFKPS